MNWKRSVVRAVAVLGVAFAAGHAVQTMNAERAAAATAAAKIDTVVSAPAPRPAMEVAEVVTRATSPVAELPPVQPVLADLTGGALAAPPAEPAPQPAVEAPAPLQAAADPVIPAPLTEPVAKVCAQDLGLAAGPKAMIALSITAPCRAGERVVLRHAGLAVAEVLGADGTLSLDLPALSEKGEVSVLFADATVIRAAVPVPEVAGLRRFAVQWMADDAFQLHVQETGAAGDVSAANPVSPRGGLLIALGNPGLALPMLAEVYTWPTDGGAQPVIEATVTKATCGRDLLGETIHLNDGLATVTDLTLSMPGCNALGDILVLNNLFPAVTLAAVN